MRNLLLAFVCLGILSAIGCKKKDQTPEEYFSFDANGVHYDYPQEKKEASLFGGGKKALSAWASNSLGYQISAYTLKDGAIPGYFLFRLYGGFPAKDTILLGADGEVSIERFINQSANYSMIPPYGRIIFTERTSERLTGTFEFYAELYQFPTFGPEVDTVIHITNGRFSIIPSRN